MERNVKLAFFSSERLSVGHADPASLEHSPQLSSSQPNVMEDEILWMNHQTMAIQPCCGDEFIEMVIMACEMGSN